MYETISKFDIKMHSQLDPTQEGREAYQARYSLSDCPYPKDSASERAWFKGWVEEDMKFRARWRKNKLSSRFVNG